MKNWKQTKDLYVKDHLAKTLEQPERRINALNAIEKVFNDKFPELLNDEQVFTNIAKVYLIKLYECLKGNSLSSAEKSVFTGLYNFSK